MKIVFPIFMFFSLLLLSCAGDPRDQLPQTGTFGEPFVIDSGVTDVNSIQMSDSAIFQITQISGVIEKYCKGEGCWLTLKKGEDSYILINTKDKGFILPKNIQGKKVVANGHFIQKDKKGKPEISFEASGIQISQ